MALTPEAETLKAEGNGFFAAGSFDLALGCYQRALELCPDNAVLHSNLSATHIGLQQWKEALAAADKCLAADPAFLKAYGRKAAAQMGLVRPGDAERTLLAGLQQDPRNTFLRGELEKLRMEDDGDQKPVRSRNGSDRGIRDMQSRTGLSMETNPPWPSEAFVAAFQGKYDTFARVFTPEDLRRRALEARLPLVSVIISGAQRQRGPDGEVYEATHSDAERGTQHSQCLQLLLDSGARVDGKDGAGWTALHHATAHHTVLDLAEMLIAAGADVNLQDRYGTYPLVSATMSSEVRSVRMLLSHGAKADLQDNDGCSALQICRFHAEIEGLIHQAHFSNRRPGGKKVCARCGKGNAKKGCTGCGAGVHYCNRACQQEHWPTHKLTCGKPPPTDAAAAGSEASAAVGSIPAAAAAAAGGGGGAAPEGLPRLLKVPLTLETKVTVLQNQQAFTTAFMANLVGNTPAGARQLGRHAMTCNTPSDIGRSLAAAAATATAERAVKVKIQALVAFTQEQRQQLISSGENPDALLCYNHDRSLLCHLDGATPEGSQLCEFIRARGVTGAAGPRGGTKAYFPCYFDETCRRENGVPREMVVVTTMLPVQNF